MSSPTWPPWRLTRPSQRVFHNDLATPGLRLPITADADAFFEAVALGREVIWLHTFGERMADP